MWSWLSSREVNVDEFRVTVPQMSPVHGLMSVA